MKHTVKHSIAALIVAIALVFCTLSAYAADRIDMDGVYLSYLETAYFTGASNEDSLAAAEAATVAVLANIAECAGANPEAADTFDAASALLARTLEPRAEASDALSAWAVITNHFNATSLASGSRGEAVRSLQAALLARDPDALPDWGADGAYGNEAAEAVTAFQASVGLPATGSCDAATLALLTAEVSDPIYALMRAVAEALGAGHPIDDTLTADEYIAMADARIAESGEDALVIAEAKLNMCCAIAAMLTDDTAKPAAAARGERNEEARAADAEAPAVDSTVEPAVEPTQAPAVDIPAEPTEEPAPEPTQEPVVDIPVEPTAKPTQEPTVEPTEAPTPAPTEEPTEAPTPAPTEEPAEEHVHNWVDVVDVRIVPEQGHWESVWHDPDWHEDTIHHEEEGHWEIVYHKEEGHWDIVHHEAVTHEETIEHPAVTRTIDHPEEGHWDTVYHNAVKETRWVYDAEVGAYRLENVVVKEAWSERVWIVDREAWTETVVDREAWTETVVVTDAEAYDESIWIVDAMAWDEQVWVVDREAWDETVTVYDGDGWYEEVWIVDAPEAIVETVIGQLCVTCGETK